MSIHNIIITIDCDPDGLSGITTNRNTNSFKSLEEIQPINQEINDFFGHHIPLTWFIRIDNQIEDFFGSCMYLYDFFIVFWKDCLSKKHELAWHPHLYSNTNENNEYEIMTNQLEIENTLDYLWRKINEYDLKIKSFRNGEGWLNSTIINKLVEFGLKTDSTALPNMSKIGHPMNWIGTPNQPFEMRNTKKDKSIKEKSILEIPMNTWNVRASYDKTAKLRYMNPAIHHELFVNAVLEWKKILDINITNEYFWVFILHPEEVMKSDEIDLLYSKSREIMYQNIHHFMKSIQDIGHSYQFLTLNEATIRWTMNQK